TQVGQSFLHASEAAGKPNVDLVQYGLAPRQSAPIIVAPGIAAGVRYDAGVVDVAVLQPRGRIGNAQVLVNAVSIACPRSAGACEFMESLSGHIHELRRLAGQLQVDLPGAGCPYAKT